jgi:hypothetical protein
LKKRYKDQEEEEEDISSYWMTLRTREGTGIRKRKHYITL